MRYAIVGTGGIGGYYGGRLARSGCEVHFLLHSDYDFVKEHGLQVDSADGSFLLSSINAYPSTSLMPQCDVVLVCLKTTQNHLLAELLPPLLKKETIVVLIQNGIGVEKDLQRFLPDTWLVAGLAFICTAKVGPGHIHHQDFGQINFGNFSCPDEDILKQLIHDFGQAGITAGLVPYEEARWKKAVWNMPFNGMTVALNTRTDLLLGHPYTRKLIREQMLEVVATARHLGIGNIDESFADQMIKMTDVMKPYSPSMKLDFDFSRPMEIEYIYSHPLQLAREGGCPMPKLEMLEAQLRFIEQHRKSDSKPR